MSMTEEAAKKLRAPFPESAIGKLPRAGIELDYVGHAAVTDRLLEVDPEWSWEPIAFDERGVPVVTFRDGDASMWIRLTVCGVTRPAVGIAKANAFELEKQLISDALRNGAMRFGVALDLWSKEPIHEEPRAARPLPDGYASEEEWQVDRDELVERIARLLPPDREAFTAWKDDQGFPFPWPRGAMEAMHSHILELVADAEPFE